MQERKMIRAQGLGTIFNSIASRPGPSADASTNSANLAPTPGSASHAVLSSNVGAAAKSLAVSRHQTFHVIHDQTSSIASMEGDLY
jgi:hypothetical protein